MTILQHGMVGSAGGYQIANSLRFRSSASAYLSRTPASAGNRQTWTWSGWAKKAGGAAYQGLFSAGSGAPNYTAVRFEANDQLSFFMNNGVTAYVQTTQVFRDPSAWYHFVLAIDTTQATASNRIKLYVNGTQVSSFAASTYPAQNETSAINNNLVHVQGTTYTSSPSLYLDGYLSEINFIDGQALTPASFGETNTDGVWVPKEYDGAHGANGFYLKFNNAASTTTLGYDSSGNSNNWTCNNISLTSGATYDHMTDTPTNNYAVLNSLSPTPNGVVSAGNLLFTGSSADWGGSKASMVVPVSGKWYAEFTLGSTSSNSNQLDMGIFPTGTTNAYDWTGGYGVEANNGFFLNSNGTYSPNRGGTTAAGSVFQIAVDATEGKLWIGVNNAWYDTYNTTNGNPSNGTFPMVSGLSFSTTTFDIAVKTYINNITANFGQRPFAYTPPTGFKALCTANLPDVAITTSGTFTGNASADGPFVWLNGNPTAMTINGNAVTFASHADKTAGGFKVRTSSSSYNASGSNSYSITSVGKKFRLPNNAQGNP